MEGKAGWQLAAIWLSGAALSGPMGIVLDELAHYLAAVIFDFPSVTMSYASINYAQSTEFWAEINAARAFGIPVDFFVWPMVLGMVLGWILAIPKLRPHLAIKLPAAILGPVIGIAAWAVVGPYVWS